MRLLHTTLAVVLAAGCASITGSGDIRITPDQPIFAVTEQITARFVNESDQEIGYGACSLFLERRTGGDWVQVEPIAVPCISILYRLPSGESVEVAIPPLVMPPSEGEYRLRQEFMPESRLPSRSVHSAPFRVSSR